MLDISLGSDAAHWAENIEAFGRRHSVKRAKGRLHRDVIYMLSLLVAAVISVQVLNTGSIVEWLHRRRETKIDETIVVGLVLLVCMCVFSARRWLELVRDAANYEKIVARLQVSEERFRRLSDSNIVGVLVANSSGEIVDANSHFLEMLGYKREDLLDARLRWDQIIQYRNRTFWPDVVTQLQDSGVWPAQQVALLHKDGSHISALVGLAAADSSKAETIGFAVDLTARTIAQEALLRAKENLAILIAASPAAIVTVDQYEIVRVWNPAAERLFGWTEREVVGQRLPTVPVRWQEEFRNRLRRCLRGEVLTANGIRRIRKDGSEVEVSVSSAPLRNADGTIVGVVSILEDITERKRAEEESHKARMAAEAANRTKSEFLANISHEIRTPMNGIIGMADLMLGTELSPEQREYVDMGRSSAESLLTVINDILDFSKIEAGKLELDSIEFSLRNTIEDIARMLAMKAYQKRLELITEIQSGVPEWLIGDPTRLRQILFNLVSNAAKFTEAGEIVLRVELTERSTDGECLRFSVTDTGIGIPRERQSQIFEAFSQVDGSITRKYGGVGLGLTISSRLVKLMGGSLSVKSESNKGSTFQFTANFGVVMENRPAAWLTDEIAAHLRNVAVMVVDDNETHRSILRGMLLKWEMRPTLVEGAQEALAILEHSRRAGTPFPLVLIDAQMPGMDGFELAEALRRDPSRTTSIIMMLASPEERISRGRCRRLGIGAYLSKPLRQSELRNAVVETLSSPHMTKTHDLEARRGSILPFPLRSMRILVVEDNRINQVVAKRLLEQRGHRVVLANDGLEAVAQLDSSVFDLVLMDLQMPEMDGLEATRSIREKERSNGGRMPIVALTAHAMKGDQERCIDAGMDGYLSKPFRREELFAAVEHFAPSSSQTKQQSVYARGGRERMEKS